MIEKYWNLYPNKKYSKKYKYHKRNHKIKAAHNKSQLVEEFVWFVISKKLPDYLLEITKKRKPYTTKQQGIILNSFKPIIVDENYDKQGLVGEYLCWLSLQNLHNQSEILDIPFTGASTTGRGIDFYELYKSNHNVKKIMLRIWEVKTKPVKGQIVPTNKDIYSFFNNNMYIYLPDLISDLQKNKNPEIEKQFNSNAIDYLEGNRLELGVFMVCDESNMDLVDKCFEQFSENVEGRNRKRQVVSIGIDDTKVTLEEFISSYKERIIEILEYCYPNIRTDIVALRNAK
ncbi:hypothetical protein QMK38_01000 [Lysinibacillus fusiformis]|nr:hypothetical protein [Lysinibacillus fusiformis]